MNFFLAFSLICDGVTEAAADKLRCIRRQFLIPAEKHPNWTVGQLFAEGRVNFNRHAEDYRISQLGKVDMDRTAKVYEIAGKNHMEEERQKRVEQGLEEPRNHMFDSAEETNEEAKE